MDLITGQNTSWEHAPQIEYCKEDSHSIQSLASFLSKILEQAYLGSSPLLAMVAGAKSQVCLLPAGELGPSSVALAHMHFIVLKLCNSAVLIYEGCISSSDPCWYRTHYFPFMCLCQRATGNQLLETDLKKQKNKQYFIVVILFQVTVPACSIYKEGNGDCLQANFFTSLKQKKKF